MKKNQKWVTWYSQICDDSTYGSIGIKIEAYSKQMPFNWNFNLLSENVTQRFWKLFLTTTTNIIHTEHETGAYSSVIRKQYANEMLFFGDDIKSHLYDAKTFRDAKYKYVRDTHIHKEPLTALCMLKTNVLKNAIDSIGVHPFYVWYSSVQQMHIYQSYCRSNPKNIIVAIDAYRNHC